MVPKGAGYPAAQAFAGHSPPTVTGTYMKVPPSEVAAAVAALTGEPHPLARPRSSRPGPSWAAHAVTAARRLNGVVGDDDNPQGMASGDEESGEDGAA